MKWFFRLLTLGSLTAILALPFYMDNPVGINGMFGSGSASPTPVLSVGQPLEKKIVREVYKWRDKNGVLQYSDVPPAQGTRSDIIAVSNQTNIIQSVPSEPEPSPVDAKNQLSVKSKKTLDEAEQKDLLSLDRAKNIIDEAKAVRELMENRNQGLEKL